MKIVDTTNSCRTCSHKMYFSGGQYECTKLNKIINDISTIPNWCPLPEYPAQVIQDVENQKAALISKIQALEIELQPGEHYAGIITGKAGELSHHVILLPGDEEGLTLSDAKTWATQAGGELPSSREQALLYANLKEQFQPCWYWSSEQHDDDADYAWGQHDDDADYAWGQHFNYGGQYHVNVNYTCHARAVRRLAVCRCVAASVEKENQNETGN